MARVETASFFGAHEHVEAQSRDQRLELLVREHFQFVWRTLRRMGLPSADADDATQQVFMVAARKLSSVREGSEKAFLFGTAMNMVARFRRAQGRRIEFGDASLAERVDNRPGPEEAIDKRRAREMLDGILAQMSEQLRVVFILHEVELMTMSAIAEVLDLAPGTVASRLRRAREAFKRALARAKLRAARPNVTSVLSEGDASHDGAAVPDDDWPGGLLEGAE